MFDFIPLLVRIQPPCTVFAFITRRGISFASDETFYGESPVRFYEDGGFRQVSERFY